MKKILVVILTLFALQGWAQTDDYPQAVEDLIYNPIHLDSLEKAITLNLFLGHFADSATLAGAFTASSYDGYWGFTDDAPWRIFISDGSNWNAIAGSGGGGGGISDVVDDTTPQLGGNLDAQTFTISNAGNITMDGTSTVDGIDISVDVAANTAKVSETVITTETETGSTRTLDENDITHVKRGLTINAAPTGTKLDITFDPGTANDWFEIILITSGDSVEFEGNGVTIHGDTLMTFQYQYALARYIDATNVVLKIEQRERIELIYAISDESTAITATTGLVPDLITQAFTLTEVVAFCSTGPSGGAIVFDINLDGTTTLSTKLSIDSGEQSSRSAATPAVISDSGLGNNEVVSFDVESSNGSPVGAKIHLIGYK